VHLVRKTIKPVGLLQVKTPAESTGPWDLYKVMATLPAASITRPLAESTCPSVKH
jgi:branched-chain amino acid transport system substrate-binding protein